MERVIKLLTKESIKCKIIIKAVQDQNRQKGLIAQEMNLKAQAQDHFEYLKEIESALKLIKKKHPQKEFVYKKDTPQMKAI